MHPLFDLTGKVAIVTGGGGLLGRRHCEIIAEYGGIPVILERDKEKGEVIANDLQAAGKEALSIQTDITEQAQIQHALDGVMKRFGQVDILVNNAANNPKMEPGSKVNFSRVANFPLEQWAGDLDVGLLGAFLCCQIFGEAMHRGRSGIILNIASELSVIAPDQRLYAQEGLPEDKQPVKPVTYSVVKTGLVGLTRYFATYYSPYVRVNALSPGGVEAGQPPEFIKKLSSLIPLGRMAKETEYQGAVLFLCSDASSYMTGQNLIVDGGRSCW
jgi:NAD(P)-dependent dehydrogenase (short-subunit alcohol dehydrogenase family)